MEIQNEKAVTGNVTTCHDVYTSATGGKSSHLNVIFNPVAPYQNPTGVLATMKDISDKKRLEAQTKAAVDHIKIFFRSPNDAIFVHPLNFHRPFPPSLWPAL